MGTKSVDKIERDCPCLILERTSEGLIALQDRNLWAIVFPPGSEVQISSDDKGNLSVAVEMTDGQIFEVPNGLVACEEPLRRSA